MQSGPKRPAHLLHKRTRTGDLLIPAMHISNNAFDDLHHLESQDGLGRDSRDGDTRSGETMSTLSEGIPEVSDAPSRKNRKQLTSTEYALQEIRSRVQAIDERWEEVNVRATNTLENIEEDDMDVKDPGRRRRSSNPTVDKRREAARKFSLRGTHESPPAHTLGRSHATAWRNDIGDSGRVVNRDERVAMALAQSHENLAAAAVRFEESQKRSNNLLGGLRGWLDSFTGTARPEDTNPIVAMLPEPGLESEVVALMTDCQDAALMLEHSTNRHTEQLREIFGQAGKLYGSEMDRVQKKGSAASQVARDKIQNLQEHANKVECLLQSMQEERASLHTKFSGAEQRCRWVEERYREDKTRLQEGISNYRHQVMQLQHVVAGYEEKARRQEQIEREPRLAPLLDKLKSPAPEANAEQLRVLHVETTRLASENAALTEANKKLYRDLIVSRLADQGGKRAGGRRPTVVQSADLESLSEASARSVVDDSGGASAADPAVKEMLRDAREKSAQAEKALLDSKRENKALTNRLQVLSVELEKEKKKPTVINRPAPDAVEEGLRGAMRDLRRQSSGQLSDEIEARRKAVGELEAALEQAHKKERAAAEANAELVNLRSELIKMQEKVQALHESAAAAKIRSDALPPLDSTPIKPQPLPVAAETPPPAPAPVAVTTPPPAEQEIQVLSPVDFGGLVTRAVSQEDEGLSHMRRKAKDAGVAQRHCDKADEVFSEVVGCCGEGLSSVERLLTGSKSIVDDNATDIQEALAAALERAIASASVLLREALIGRIRACEAEKQTAVEHQTAEVERARAEALSRDKAGLVDELQQQREQAGVVRKEVAAVRRDAENATENFRLWREKHTAVVENDTPPALEQQQQQPPPIPPTTVIADAPPSPKAEEAMPPLQPVVDDDSATWRRRYEHLASLLTKRAKEDSGKASPPAAPATTRPATPKPLKGRSPRQAAEPSSSERSASMQKECSALSTTTSAAPSSVGAQSDATPIKTLATVVDGSSNTTPRPSRSPEGENGRVRSAAPVALVSTGVSASDVPPSGADNRESTASTDRDVGVATERKSSSESAVQVRSSSAQPETSDGGMQANMDDAANDMVASPGESPSGQEGKIGFPADKSHEDDEGDVVVPQGASAASASVPSHEGSSGALDTHGAREEKGKIVNEDGPVDTIVNVEKRSEKTATQKSEEIESSRDGSQREGGTFALDAADENSEKDASDGPITMRQPKITVISDAKEGAHEGRGGETTEQGQQSQQYQSEDIDDGSGHGSTKSGAESRSLGSPEASAASTASTATGRGRYASIDGEVLLGKLLDESAPSTAFEDDHQQLLNKLMKARDKTEDGAPSSPLSSTVSCLECPVLRDNLGERSAEVQALKEQQLAAQQELEASEHRVHVMAADIASFQRKLAEHADVIRHGRALADKVAAAPHTEVPEVQAAQDFKALSDKVANARGDSRGKGQPRGQDAAAAATTGPAGRASGRAEGRQESKSTQPLSSRDDGRRGTSVVPRVGNSSGRGSGGGGGGGGGERGNGSNKQRRRQLSGSSSSDSSQRRQTRRRRIGNGGSSGINSNKDKMSKTSTPQQRMTKISSEEGRGERSQGEATHTTGSSKSDPAPRSLAGASTEEVPVSGHPAGAEDGEKSRTGTIVERVEASDTATVNAALDKSEKRLVGGECLQETNGTYVIQMSHGSQNDSVEVYDVTRAGQEQGAAASGASTAEGAMHSGTKPCAEEESMATARLATNNVCYQDERQQREDPGDSLALATVAQDRRESEYLSESQPQAFPALQETSEGDHISPSPVPGSSLLGDWGAVFAEREEEREEERMAGTPKQEAEGDEFRGVEPDAGKVQWRGSTTPTEFIPTERSLAAFCQAAARCKLCIEACETSARSSLESVSTPGDDGVKDGEKDGRQQRLIERYSVLKDAMTEWGVEAAQALLVEVTKTAAKHRTISAWTSAIGGTDRGNNGERLGGGRNIVRGSSVRSLRSQHARQERATLLMTEKTVLEEVVEACGGWEAAVFLESGLVNLDVDVAAWPVEDQLAILTALNDHLRDELEESETRHDRAFGDILGRLQASQREAERMRAEHEMYMLGRKSPEATPERFAAEETVHPAAPSQPLPEKVDEKQGESSPSDGQGEDATKEQSPLGEDKDEGRDFVPSARDDADAERVSDPTSVEESMREANRQLQMQLTMSIAKQRRVNEDLRKERERANNLEEQLQQEQQRKQQQQHQQNQHQHQHQPRHQHRHQQQPAVPTDEHFSPQEVQHSAASPPASATPREAATPAPTPATPAPVATPQTPPSHPPVIPIPITPPTQPQPLSKPLDRARPPEPVIQPPPRQRVIKKNKGFDLIAQADESERRERAKEEARLEAGYPLVALALERQAVADLRTALTKAVCAVLELCQQQQEQPQPEPRAAAADGGGYRLTGRMPEADGWCQGDRRVNATRGPPSTLVQMVCSGDNANVRCATAEYRLCTGTAMANRSSTAVTYAESSWKGGTRYDTRSKNTTFSDGRGKHSHLPSPSPSWSQSQQLPSQVVSAAAAARNESKETGEACPGRSKFLDLATTVAESGTMARTILTGLMPTNTQGKTQKPPSPLPSEDEVLVAQIPPENPREALSAAIAATAEVISFCAGITVDVGVAPNNVTDPEEAGGGMPWASRGVATIAGGAGARRAPTAAPVGGVSAGESGGAEEVNTTASKRIVDALRRDVLWAESLPAFVRKTIEARQGGFAQQIALKEREIVILSEAHRELKRDLRAFKADYVSADAEDVIRALRKRQRELSSQLRYQERQLELAQQSSEVEGGAIEVLEGLLRKRDTDKQLFHSLGLKSLEIGLKIRLLETDAGGKTVEVSHMGQEDQRAVAHLKGRLTKERETTDHRKNTIAAELDRSLPHSMRAFERVSRTIQRLCNGHTSLPGLLEWGRTTAARLEATADTGKCRLDGNVDGNATHHTTQGDGGGRRGGEKFESWKARHDRLLDGRRAPGEQRPGSATGVSVNENSLTPSTTHLVYSGSRSTEDGLGGGAWALPIAAGISFGSASTSASTVNLYGRARNAVTPDAQEVPYCRVKNRGVRGAQNKGSGAEETRKWPKTAEHITRDGNATCSGVLWAAEYGDDASDVASLGGYHGGGGGGGGGGGDGGGHASSVAILLREERAFRRRTRALLGTREEEREMARGHAERFAAGYPSRQGGGVPALVPLNNVGLPVRLRRKHALQAAR